MSSAKYIQCAAPFIVAISPGIGTAEATDTTNWDSEYLTEDAQSTLTIKNFISTGNKDIVRSVNSNEWDAVKQSRFNELAAKHAFDKTSIAEERELNRLQSVRLRELSLRSYEEVKREFEVEKATRIALEAIDNLIKTVSHR